VIKRSITKNHKQKVPQIYLLVETLFTNYSGFTMAQWYWQSDLRKRASENDKEAWTVYSAEDSAKIEKAFNKNQKSLSLNDTYTIVFGCMEQQRKDDKSRRRFIRREVLAAAPAAAAASGKATTSAAGKRKASSAAADEEEDDDEAAAATTGRKPAAAKKAATAKKDQKAPSSPLKSKTIEYDKIFEEYNGETATDAAIAKAEKDLKKTLPASYKKLMKMQNGGDIKGDRNCHPSGANTSWAGNHVCIGMLFSLVEPPFCTPELID
jgi:hypothetical protein